MSPEKRLKSRIHKEIGWLTLLGAGGVSSLFCFFPETTDQIALAFLGKMPISENISPNFRTLLSVGGFIGSSTAFVLGIEHLKVLGRVSSKYNQYTKTRSL